MTDAKDRASEVRRVLSDLRYGLLSTHSLRHSGFPFGSMVPYLFTDDRCIVIKVARIAEHYRNLREDGRGSLCVIDPGGSESIESAARATVLVTFEEVGQEEDELLRLKWRERFGQTIPLEIEPSFAFLRGLPYYIRWIGGFGEAAWIRGEDLR